ncbi:MAG: response regulator [Lachnospiraceae bacterium]|nr:response regulator [Lachnospiraceae bacterium]
MEDHPVNRMVAAKLSAQKNSTVLQAENGQVALSCFEQNQPYAIDLIIMDIRMPVLNGLEATAKIRELPRPDASTVPIIAMTANAYDEDRRISKAAGMNEHLAKPLDKRLLYETVARFLCPKIGH